MKALAHLALALALTFTSMTLWVVLANLFRWALFTTWGMVHGGFMLALPVCWLASFGGLFLVPWFRQGWPKLALLGAGLLIALPAIALFRALPFFLQWLDSV